MYILKESTFTAGVNFDGGKRTILNGTKNKSCINRKDGQILHIVPRSLMVILPTLLNDHLGKAFLFVSYRD